jgi:hypothetical protein
MSCQLLRAIMIEYLKLSRAYQQHVRSQQPRGHILNTSLSIQLTNGPHKLNVCPWQAFPALYSTFWGPLVIY